MVRIDCLLTCVHCFFHRCVALWQRLLNVNHLYVHNNIRSLRDKAGNLKYANSTFKRTESKRKKRLVIFWRKENVEIIRVNDLLKAQEVSKEKG